MPENQRTIMEITLGVRAILLLSTFIIGPLIILIGGIELFKNIDRSNWATRPAIVTKTTVGGGVSSVVGGQFAFLKVDGRFVDEAGGEFSLRDALAGRANDMGTAYAAQKRYPSGTRLLVHVSPGDLKRSVLEVPTKTRPLIFISIGILLSSIAVGMIIYRLRIIQNEEQGP